MDNLHNTIMEKIDNRLLYLLECRERAKAHFKAGKLYNMPDYSITIAEDIRKIVQKEFESEPFWEDD